MGQLYFLLLVTLVSSDELLTAKKTEQSSTFTWYNYEYRDGQWEHRVRWAQNAYDRNTETCSETENDMSNWWYINLGAEKAVSRVVVKNGAAESNKNKFDGTKVYVDAHICGEIKVDKYTEIYEINCGGAVGSSVMLRQDGKDHYLLLCEVEVYGGAPSAGNPVHNLALNRHTEQSSVASGGISSRAVDGNYAGDYSEGTCTMTDGSAGGAWWMVDLAAKSNIQAVMIYNRLDNGSWRLHDAEAFVGKTSCGKVNMKQSDVNDRTAVFILRCPEGTVGDKVVIQKYSSGALALCEVKVIGNRVE